MPPPTVLSRDEIIIGLMRDGCEDGLRELLQEHGAAAKAYIRNRFSGLCSSTGIDEVFNESAYNAWRFAHQFDNSRGTLRSWFIGIARRVCLTKVRQRGLQTLEPALCDLFSEVATIPLETRLLRDLRETIRHLPRLQKSIIESDIAAGGVADASELARNLETTRNSILVSRHKARQNLKRELQDRGHFQDR